jgi:hypothetical protein
MNPKVINVVEFYAEPYYYSKDAACIVCNNIVSDLGGRNRWIKILNTNNNKAIYRKTYGAGKTHLNYDQIQLDYDSINSDLGIDIMNNCSLELYSATCLGQIIGHCKHPDLKYRIPLIIGSIGLILGMISLVITFLTICIQN